MLPDLAGCARAGAPWPAPRTGSGPEGPLGRWTDRITGTMLVGIGAGLALNARV
ncbi:LysR-family transcriptional regulator [Actinomyces sp. oral taxon 448 str. F0400]|nr:LysR-family transcriptional regulator [Actinomyces sp. oral taxon 448 str. F0400]